MTDRMAMGQIPVRCTTNLTRDEIELGEKLHPHVSGFECLSGF
jgi:hypothetical protein